MTPYQPLGSLPGFVCEHERECYDVLCGQLPPPSADYPIAPTEYLDARRRELATILTTGCNRCLLASLPDDADAGE